jgi:hypothetical protein
MSVVATKKDRKLYTAVEDKDAAEEFEWRCHWNIAVQQTDLLSTKIFVNGKPHYSF